MEDRIIADPEIEAFLVYGDWLSEQGDPRGELVMVQTELMKSPENRELREREAEILATHGAAWTGGATVSWSCGFLEWARVGSSEQLADLLGRAHMTFLRRLTISPFDGQPTLDELVARGDTLRALTSLSIEDTTGEREFTDLGEFRAVGDVLQALRTLAIRLDYAHLATIHLPALQTLHLYCPQIDGDSVAALAQDRWRELRRLVIAFDPDEPAGLSADELLAPLTANQLPALRELAIQGGSFGDAVLEGLRGTELLRQLESLDVTDCFVGESGLDMLRRHAAEFAHLEAFDVEIYRARDEALEARLPNATIEWREYGED